MENVYSIILANGNRIDNLQLNGNNYISTTEILESTFSGRISPVEILHNSESEIHERYSLERIANWDGKWWILFHDKSDEEFQKEQNRADIDYVLMLLDTE